MFRHRPALFNWMGQERSGTTQALRSLNLRAAAGKVLVLLGPNGSGKTTLLKLVAGMLLPDRGTVNVMGADTRTAALAARRAVGFAVSAERSWFARLTARENLDFFAAMEDIPRAERRERVEDVLDALGLANDGDTLAVKFSSGMYQRLGIARALLKRPAVLLLDEATRSLDLLAASYLLRMVRETAENGCTVILATHNLEEAIAAGGAVALLKHGELCAYEQFAPGTSSDSLRSFYLHHVGELEPEPAALEASVR
jgi:ABC-2 type transport system ATP-binding protein